MRVHRGVAYHRVLQNEQLREWVQKLCQSVNPLGKCVDFVHEDMDMMTRELSRWQKEFETQQERLEVEKRYGWMEASLPDACNGVCRPCPLTACICLLSMVVRCVVDECVSRG